MKNAVSQKIKSIVLLFLALVLFPRFISAQNLSGIWEGTYTHFYPSCCNEYNYQCRFKVYEDKRGGMWIESLLNPVFDEEAIGQLFTAGYRMANGKIVFTDMKILYSTNFHLDKNSCFKNCRWCEKEYIFDYSKKGKVEELTGFWNSAPCYPGGAITIKKIADLQMGDNIDLMKLSKEAFEYFNPHSLSKQPLFFRKSNNPGEVMVSLGYSRTNLKVENPDDFVGHENDFIIQNITSKLIPKSSGLTITYYELTDKRNGKKYVVNLDNVQKNEIQNSLISGKGLVVPNKKEWEEIYARYSRDTAKISTQQATATNFDITTDAPAIEQIKERDITVRQGDIRVSKSADVYIEVWDNNVEDGDIISLYVNDVCVLNKFTLTKQKKRVSTLPLKNGRNTVTMFAENLGDIPPNTASVSIYADGKLLKTLIMESDMSKSEALNLVVE